MDLFERTMNNSQIFLTYSLSLSMLGKSAKLLTERGADPEAMRLISRGMDRLAQQLRVYYEQKKAGEEIDSDLNAICEVLGIGRADENAA